MSEKSNNFTVAIVATALISSLLIIRVNNDSISPYGWTTYTRVVMQADDTTKQPLPEHFLVDINSGEIDELLKIPCFDEKIAQNIIEYQHVNGDIKSFDELLAISGVDEEMILTVEDFAYIK